FFGSYWNFWPSHAFLGVYPEGNFSWHHLWFLPYLLVFSLCFTPVFLYFRNNPSNRFLRWIEQQLESPLGFLWFLAPLLLTQIFLKPYFPETHALIGDWFTLANYSILFLYGFMLIMIREVFWKMVQQNRRIFFLIGIFSFSFWLLLIFNAEGFVFAEALKPLVKVINCWS